MYNPNVPKPNRRMPLEERFWAKVQKTDTCWLWIGQRNPEGYGNIAVEGTTRNAHRVSWEMAFGHIARGLLVMHICDNPPCVRPDHLRLGTPKDNMQDMIQKDRQKKGESKRGSKLTYKWAEEIRAAYVARKTTYQQLAEKYGVTQNAIRQVVAGKTWVNQ